MENVRLHTIYLKIYAMEGAIVLHIFNPWNNVYNGVRGGILIYVPIMLKYLLKVSAIQRIFKVENVHLHQFISNISAMEGEIIWAFLIHRNIVYNGVEANF